MKKTMLSLLAGVLSLTCLLASCGKKNDTPKDTTEKPTSKVTESVDTKSNETDTKKTEVTTAKPDDSDKPSDEAKVGDTYFYNMAYYLSVAEPSNATEEDNHKFLQNISQGYARIDDDLLVNDDDVYQLFWSAVDIGDTLTIPFKVSATGTYSVKFSLHMGGDFGTFQVYFDDEMISSKKGVDVYRSADGGLYDFELGQAVLEAGDHELIFRLKGQNAMSAGRVFGISSMTLTLDSFDTTPIVRPDEPDEVVDPVTTVKAATMLDTAKTDNTSAEIFVQDMSDGWKRIDSVADMNLDHNMQLFWASIKVGNELKLKLNVTKSSLYDLSLLSNRGGDYGTFSVTLNGEVLTDNYCLTGSDALTTSFKNVALVAGDNEFVFKCTATYTNDSGNADSCVFAVTTFAYEEAELTVAKPALWLDTAKTANEGKDIFVQDMTDSWKRLDNTADMNEAHALQLFWGGIKVGDELKLTMNVEKAGEYYLAFLSNHGGDYGAFELKLNGTVLTSEYNLNGSGNGIMAFAKINLNAGANEIVFKCTATYTLEGGKAADSCVFGITSISYACTTEPV